MKNYSRQLDKFIDAEDYATSGYRKTDSRTWVSYAIDNNGLIHSSSFNYSIVGCNPVSVDDFSKLVDKNPDAKVNFIQSNN